MWNRDVMDTEKITLGDIRANLGELGDPWEAGVTSLSSLPLSEKKKYLGVKPPEGEKTIEEIEQLWISMAESQKASAIGSVGAPAAYDLRNVNGSNFVTDIRNQKNCGSCVAFGTVATIECQIRLQYGNPNYPVDLSEAHLFFCHARECNANCSTGWWPTEAFDAFQSKGVADESCYPYDNGLSKQDCSGLCSNSVLH
jgi:C1A family cysteine protease